VAILTGILFGIAPAWRSSREDPAIVLQQNARNLSGGTGNLSKALIITQVALSLVLLLGAGLLARSFEKLCSIDLGFQKESVLEIALYPKPGGYQNLDVNSYHKQLLERISSLPGVGSVSFGDATVPSPQGWHDTVSPMTADSSTGIRLMANAALVSPGFFRTLAIPLLRGRDFNETDDKKHARIAIVNSNLAERLFPNGDAIGKSIRFGFMPDYENIEIVGIARNARIFDIRDATTPVIFLSSFQYPHEWGGLIVRTKEAPEALAKTVGHEVESLGHEYVLRTRTVAQQSARSLSKSASSPCSPVVSQPLRSSSHPSASMD
jgi:ABC-type antimicrobial peptide transport system permease subunit